MAAIPTLREARLMVRKALKERVPEKYADLEKSQELATFSDLLAGSIVEKILALDDPAPALRGERPLMQQAKAIRDIRDEAIDQVLAEMLSTANLEAETSAYRSAA